jgi:hypothetical protein
VGVLFVSCRLQLSRSLNRLTPSYKTINAG